MSTLGDHIEAALIEFPEARPLADLIVANSAEEALAVAEQLAERMKTLRPALTPTEPASASSTDGDQAAPQRGYQPPGHEAWHPDTVT